MISRAEKFTVFICNFFSISFSIGCNKNQKLGYSGDSFENIADVRLVELLGFVLRNIHFLNDLFICVVGAEDVNHGGQESLSEANGDVIGDNLSEVILVRFAEILTFLGNSIKYIFDKL
jgi:hypothetical protein